MKERPILFNANMVRAILSGQKTQTRRVFSPRGWTHEQLTKYEYVHTIVGTEPKEKLGGTEENKCAYAGFKLSPDSSYPSYFKCPFGNVGDQLWVRETFQGPLVDEIDGFRANSDEFKKPEFCEYAADGGKAPEFMTMDDDFVCRWKPSIHMPRWASRIQLEITGIRVEKLQDISEEDAKAEGVMQLDCNDFERPSDHHKNGLKLCPMCAGTGLHNALGANLGVIYDVDCTDCDTHAKLFKHLWNSTGGDWDANPHVWVIEFRVIK